MEDSERQELTRLTLAPYIQKATALIGCERRVGGNQFRHAMATLAILLDYHYTDAVLLKASLLHDLLEEVPDTDRAEIRGLDEDGDAVLALVDEVTRVEGEPKPEYLRRLRDHGSWRAKVLKVADRLSNLTDLNTSVFADAFVQRYLDETVEFVFPVATEVNDDMAVEARDLVERRLGFLSHAGHGGLPSSATNEPALADRIRA